MRTTSETCDAYAVQLAAATLSLIGLVAATALFVDAKGGSRADVSQREEALLARGEGRGKGVFEQHCNACHPGGSAGKGPALLDKPLPEAVIRARVRHGGGAMPPFAEHSLSEEDLADLIEYVVALRRSSVARRDDAR